MFKEMGSWENQTYNQIAEILCQLLNHKGVEPTNLFHRMMEKLEQEGIITKPHCQKNSPCVANWLKKKKKKATVVFFSNVALPLMSSYKIQVRCGKMFN